MPETVIEGKVLRWGNSYGIRIRKADLEKADLQPGEEAIVRIESKRDKVDISHVHFFDSGHTDTSERHDEVLGEARTKDLEERDG